MSEVLDGLSGCRTKEDVLQRLAALPLHERVLVVVETGLNVLPLAQRVQVVLRSFNDHVSREELLKWLNRADDGTRAAALIDGDGAFVEA